MRPAVFFAPFAAENWPVNGINFKMGVALDDILRVIGRNSTLNEHGELIERRGFIENLDRMIAGARVAADFSKKLVSSDRIRMTTIPPELPEYRGLFKVLDLSEGDMPGTERRMGQFLKILEKIRNQLERNPGRILPRDIPPEERRLVEMAMERALCFYQNQHRESAPIRLVHSKAGPDLSPKMRAQ